MKVMSIISLILGVIGMSITLIIYSLCEKIKSAGNIRAGVLDNLDIDKWEDLVHFKGLSINTATNIQLLLIPVLIIILFFIGYSIFNIINVYNKKI
jgi:hypothetical protein